MESAILHITRPVILQSMYLLILQSYTYEGSFIRIRYYAPQKWIIFTSRKDLSQCCFGLQLQRKVLGSVQIICKGTKLSRSSLGPGMQQVEYLIKRPSYDRIIFCAYC